MICSCKINFVIMVKNHPGWLVSNQNPEHANIEALVKCCVDTRFASQARECAGPKVRK